jgi:hypothetical protein
MSDGGLAVFAQVQARLVALQQKAAGITRPANKDLRLPVWQAREMHQKALSVSVSVHLSLSGPLLLCFN